MLTVPMRDGSYVADPRLDRLKQFDEKSREFQVRALLQAGPSGRTSAARNWKPGPTLDQQSEGQCVSEACHDRRNGSPLKRKPSIVEFAERRHYYLSAQHRDPWPGCSEPGHCGPNYGGTSILAGMAEGQARGWWSEYRWIGAGSGTLENDVIDTLRTVGGIIFGIEWRSGMYETDANGLVSIDGDVVGGHAIHGFAWIPRLRLPGSFRGTRPAVALHNSWGPAYGVRKYGVTGVGFILLDDLMALLARDGEGAVPLK